MAKHNDNVYKMTLSLSYRSPSMKSPRPPSWICIWRHYSAAVEPIWTKFGRPSLMQYSTPIIVMWSKSQPEEEFRYGGRLFLQTGSCYISAENWDMSMKFSQCIDFELRKSVATLNTKPEVVLRHRCCHLEIAHYVITLRRIARLGRNLVTWCRIARIWSKSQREEEFQ